MNRRTFLGVGLGAAASLAFSEPPELAALTVKKASELLRSKAGSPLDLTRACLARIEKFQPLLNAFITVTPDEALAEARMLQDESQRASGAGRCTGFRLP